MNMVAIIGNAITDPDLRYTEAGGAVCTLRVAVARLDDTKNPDVFTVVCWGRQAEIVAEYVTKGRRVGIDGRLHHSAGEPVEIIASRVQLLGEGAPRGPFADGVPGELQARYNAPGGVLESDDHTRGFAIVEGVPDEL